MHDLWKTLHKAILKIAFETVEPSRSHPDYQLPKSTEELHSVNEYELLAMNQPFSNHGRGGDGIVCPISIKRVSRHLTEILEVGANLALSADVTHKIVLRMKAHQRR